MMPLVEETMSVRPEADSTIPWSGPPISMDLIGEAARVGSEYSRPSIELTKRRLSSLESASRYALRAMATDDVCFIVATSMV